MMMNIDRPKRNGQEGLRQEVFREKMKLPHGITQGLSDKVDDGQRICGDSLLLSHEREGGSRQCSWRSALARCFDLRERECGRRPKEEKVLTRVEMLDGRGESGE